MAIIYRSDTVGDPKNKVYQIPVKIDEVESFREAVTKDHMLCKMADGERCKENFQSTSWLYADIDNDSRIEEKDIITIEQFMQEFAAYRFWIATSRNHGKVKHDGEEPRERFHVFFDLDCEITEKQTVEEYLRRLVHLRPYFDASCKDVSRFFFGNPNVQIIRNEGICITEKIDSIVAPEVVPSSDIQTRNYSLVVGNRNNSLFGQATAMYGRGYRPEHVLTELSIRNSSIKEPLAQNEFMDVLKSAQKYYDSKLADKLEKCSKLEWNDFGLTDRLLIRYGNIFKSASDSGNTYYWDKNRWRIDQNNAHMHEYAVVMLRQVVNEKIYIDEDKREGFDNFVGKMEFPAFDRHC